MNVKVKTFSKENEYVELPQLNHECPFRPYFKFNNFVSAPNFELRTEMVGGKEKKRIIIFDQKDKTKCFIYYFHSRSKLYICIKCVKKRLQVSAKLCQNSDGENYVITSNTKHVCEMVKYVPQNNDNIILHPPNFKVISNGKQKVFVFDQKNKTLGYIFTHLANNRYQCNGCTYFLRKNIKKNDFKSPGNFYLCLRKNENDEYYVQMKNNQKHLCQPRKYQPEKLEIRELKISNNYFYYQKKTLTKSINVAIFHSSNSNLCFTFSYCKSSNYFHCLNCTKLKKNYHIRPPKKDENGKEYFVHDPSKHSCKPIKVSSISTSNFQNLERKDITFEGESKKEMKIDEKRIIKLPNFEFRPNKFGEPEGTLVVFDSKDKSFCYEYYYHTSKEIFVCSKCQIKHSYVTAKIHVDEENGEKFIKLSKKEHICQPIKDAFAEKVIAASKFTFLNRDDETKPTKIIVFTSEKKEFYYEFRYIPSHNNYLCGVCWVLKKRVCVKSYKKENGDEYLMTLKNDKHVCEPKKYDPKNFL
uniref:Uncharacterized protein n=1 Tax=Panagrolaimus davidi TaxID=227884 RepID=A0A914Q8Z3_9BILA